MMANVDVSFAGMEDLRRQIERLNDSKEKRACMEECADSLAQVYLAEAIKNTPVGGAREFEVAEKAYSHIRAVEVGAKEAAAAKRRTARNFHAVKRIKRRRKRGNQYLVITASEHMRRSWDAEAMQKKGQTYSVKVFNTASYASYVNDGHRQRPGRFVPAIGKRLVRSWVPGQHMAEKAEKKTRRVSKRLLSQIITAYLERRLL
ncbi:HK97 gp10 family phage protein [uncultured Megasphaera sp.]|uniref:HK97 gp10 family phage protein n=1 Tax=uncultured Megasphaera sp. TaxID=165188 RepID=UPI00265A6DE8|nr:HK97 gp10 family phage protein [uncultured Megasphaera sp.]